MRFAGVNDPNLDTKEVLPDSDPKILQFRNHTPNDEAFGKERMLCEDLCQNRAVFVTGSKGPTGNPPLMEKIGPGIGSQSDVGVSDVGCEKVDHGLFRERTLTAVIHSPRWGALTATALAAGLLVPANVLLRLDGCHRVFIHQILFIPLLVDHDHRKIVESGDLPMEIGTIGKM